MMWFLLLLLYAARIELVITQGEIRLYLNGTNSNPCHGHIEVYYKGTRGFVGDQDWNKDTEEVVCKSTQCGEAVDSSKEAVRWSIGKVWLSQLDCRKRPENLWDCKHPGWGADSYKSGHLRNIQCSEKIKLKLEGHHCSGVVMYSTNDGKTGYFCGDNWGAPEDKLLCKNIKCGDGTSQRPHVTSEVLESFRVSEEKMTVKCSGITNPDHLWQCVTGKLPSCKKPASVTCSGYERLQLKMNPPNACSGELQIERNDKWEPVVKSQIGPNEWCQQMHCGVKGETSMVDNTIQLKCSDDVKVVLMDNKQPSYCYGEVYVKVNDTSQPVCASSWGDKDADMVCRELNCGEVISHSKKPNDGKPGIMDNVECSGKESSLWHCRAKHDNDLCSSIAYVVCAGSVKVKLADGPGRCAGRLEIQHEGQWKRVDKKGWTDSHSKVVCREMDCGSHREDATFSQGSGEFLTMTEGCDDNSKNVAECLKKATSQRGGGQNQEVGIICQEHKVVILKGKTACSGNVGIVQGTKTSWLSGSEETWNIKTANTVCQQMQCGNATVFEGRNTSADMLKNISNESYNCSSLKASLFDCVKPSPLPSTHNKSFAYVECSGNISVTLTEDCWGKVNICMGTKCGGVCADAWTPDKSEMLCKDLGCGERALDAIFKPPKSKVIFKSLHTTGETTNLTQCNFVSTDEDGIICVPAYVVCSDSVKSIMNASRDNCAGHVLVSYEGKELPVCRNALGDSKTQNTICKELGCDKAGELIDYFGPKSKETNVISQIDCPDNSESLKDCRITTSTVPCTLGALQCSSWKKIALTTDERACSGAVSVFSEGKISLVSIKGWTEKAGERLCRDLDCGSPKKNWAKPSNQSIDFSCAGVEDPGNIWECKNQNSTKNEEQLFIECQDEPSITLSKKCHGEVKINNVNVCSTGWKPEYSHLVCQQSCGSAITWERISKKVDSNEYFHVHCEDNHYKLGQCKRFKGKCDDGLVSVHCTSQNVTFNFPDCGGQLSIKYRDDWEKVCPLKEFDQKFKDQLCEEKDCGFHRNIKSQNTKTETLSTTLSCGEHINDINYCIKDKGCVDIPAEIYCNKYVLPTSPPPPPPDRTVPITLGVVFFLVLVILIVVFIRIYIVKRGKKGMNASSRMLSRQEVEFESGDYEDVKNKDNEMEDLSRSRFMPESEVITENDAQSASSLPYDDIDDMLEAQPLTPQAAAAGASGNNYMREGASDQSEDGVTYEVDDPQENYDDIEAGPEITQTEAEIHKIPQTAPESDTAPPPELVEGDDDYLVPGADG